jgi:hypothetical protein
MLLAVLPAIPQREPRCRSILPSSSATRSRVVDRRYRCVQCGTANVTGVQTACHSRSPTNPGRRSPPRHRHYPHKCPTHRGFVQSGFCEVALTSPLPIPVVPATSQNPQDSKCCSVGFDNCALAAQRRVLQHIPGPTGKHLLALSLSQSDPNRALRRIRGLRVSVSFGPPSERENSHRPRDGSVVSSLHRMSTV